MRHQKFAFAAVLAMSFTLANAQPGPLYGPNLTKILDTRTTKGWLYFLPNTNVAPDQFFKIYAADMYLGAADSLKLVKQNADQQGNTHYFFNQISGGVRVIGGEFFLHTNADHNLVFANGKLVEKLNVPTTPTMTSDQALASAKAKMGATLFRWESPFWENDIKIRKGPNATYFPKIELVIAESPTGGYRLAYVMDLFSANPTDEKRYVVDANTGGILSEISLQHDCNGTTAGTIFNGSRGISTDKFATGPDNFRTRDDCTAAIINIRDWNSATTTSSPVDITSATNTWTTNNQRFAATVLWATEQAAAYYLGTFSRNSYDNSNGDVDGFINAQFAVSGSATPTANNASMSFSGGTLKVGLGNAGTLGNSFGALDILGHEYTHAVTGSEAGLVYSGESGALNESFSDIFGEMVENATLGNCDFLVGNDRTNGALRNMTNPNARSDPDTYLGTNWVTIGGTCDGTNDNCGVHTNSGVQNFWFFLLSEGGSGTNDNGDPFNVTGIGRADAQRIAYRSLTDILTSGSGYAGARNGAIQAANLIFGNCSFQTQQVINAWNAVGVYSATSDCGCGTNIVVPSGVEASENLESSTFIRSTATVNSGSNVTYDAATKIELKAGFWAKKGSRFHAIIDGCFGKHAKPPVAATSLSDGRTVDEKTLTNTLERTGFAIFPNPTSGEIQVLVYLEANAPATLQLLNLQGETLQTMPLPAENDRSERTVRFDVGRLPPGIYFCALSNGRERFVQKVVVE